ncbi:MAG: hypothetical protein IJU23_00385, partial [Proteobacteria bacterium]|nr:hypothetical protein [Pseudomonadota bacterium]
GNGEGLFGARNENSVLFSLDSLTALDKGTSDNSTGSSSSSGDASGLIDLSTLANMSNSGSSDSLADEPVMESMVFNQVVTKKSKRNIALIIAAFVIVIGGAIGTILYISHSSAEKARIAQEEQAKIDAEKAKEAEEADAKIKALEQQIKEAQAEGKRREADQKAVEEELKKLNEQKQRLLADGATDPTTDTKNKKDTKKPDGKPGGSGGSDTAAPPAPQVKKAPDKAKLIAALKDANAKAMKCGKGGNLTVQFNLSNNSAKGVKAVGGSFAGSATEKCILTVVQKYSWPDGTASDIKYTFKF